MSVPATAAPAVPGSGAEASSTGRTGATNAQEPRADPTQVSSAESQEQATPGPDYFRQAFAQMRGYTQIAAPAPAAQQAPATASSTTAPQAPPASGDPAPESGGSEASQPSARPASNPAATTLAPQREQAPRTPAAQKPDDRVTLTREEFQRQVQAEADRKLAKQQRDEAARAERDREVELRRTNPFEYARLMEAKEQELQTAQQETKRLTDLVSQQLFQYDRNVLDIFVSALPEQTRASVIAKEEGIPGRKATAANTLKALRSAWVAEGRASAKADLMKDQTFIKEVLARFGGQTPEPESNPVQVRPVQAGSTPVNGNEAVNTWMRSAARSIRS